MVGSLSLKLPDVLTIVTNQVTLTLSPPANVDTAGLSRMTTRSLQYLLCETNNVAPFAKFPRLEEMSIL